MENASKALLIAGSILIAILLIAMGVRVFNSTKGTVDSAETTMNTAEVAMFNNKFTMYFGTNKTKADVMSLVNVVVASNATSGRTIAISFIDGASINTSGITSYIMQDASKLSPTGKYTIDSYYLEGYVSQIRIRKQ